MLDGVPPGPRPRNVAPPATLSAGLVDKRSQVDYESSFAEWAVVAVVGDPLLDRPILGMRLSLESRSG